MKQDDQVKIRISTKLKLLIQKAASIRGMSMSDYIRDRVMGHVHADLRDGKDLLESNIEDNEEEPLLAQAA